MFGTWNKIYYNLVFLFKQLCESEIFSNILSLWLCNLKTPNYWNILKTPYGILMISLTS